MKVSSGLDKVMELAAAERERLLARAYRTEDEADRIALVETEYARRIDAQAMLEAARKIQPEEDDRSKGGDRR